MRFRPTPPAGETGVLVAGAVDDIIGYYGSVHDEAGCTTDGARMLFDTGVEASIVYGSGGIWKITVKLDPLGETVLDECFEETDDGRYTDTLWVPRATGVITNLR